MSDANTQNGSFGAGETQDDTLHNELRATTVRGHSVQAGSIHGGIQFNVGTRSPIPVPAQLPFPAFFANRRQELTDLRRLSTQNANGNHTSLVVITGAGGVGKTTLALHWLYQLRSNYTDGQLFIDLRGFSGDELPMPANEPLERFLRALGIRAENMPINADEQAALFRSLTAGRRLIVMLDNAASAAQVRPLLPGPGPSLVVVTTRRRLSGLTVEGARFLDLDPLDESGAVELLDHLLGADRVEAEAREARSLVTLCGRLPLAVLASGARLARRHRWPIARVVRELADENRRLSALSMEDEISVNAVFDVSYRALPDDMARLYRLLSLHPGTSFDAAAGAALAGIDADRAADLLDMLAETNLLQETAEDRYSFHDLLRLHAREKLAEIEPEPDRDAAFVRLADWYLRTAVAADMSTLPKRWYLGRYYAHYAAEPQTVFADRTAGLDWLELELPNLIAVADRSHRRGLHAITWEMCEALRTLFSLRKHYRRWIESHEVGLSAARADGSPTAQARMLEALALVYLNLRDFPTAIQYSEQALELEQGAGHRIGEATALENLGIAELGTGNPERAGSYFARARDIHRELDRPRGVALMDRRLGETAVAADRLAEGIELFTAALRFFAQSDEQYHEARSLRGLAGAYLRTGRENEADGALQKALAITTRIGARHEEASVHVALADVAAQRHDSAAERDHLRLALAIFTELEAPQTADITRRLAERDDRPPDAAH